MKFICNQNELSQAINIVQKAVSTKSTLPVLKGIYLEAHNNQLRLVGNDLSIGIDTVLSANIESEGSVVISSKIFGEIIRKLPNDNVSIEVDSSKNVHIECLGSKFNIQGQSSEEYPELPEVDENNSYDIDSDLLKNMIRQTIFATSQDESRLVLTGVLVEIKNRVISMVAIDGYRLALKTGTLGSDIENKAIIPGKTLSEVGKIISAFDKENSIKISFTDKHILFKVDNIKVISRLLDGDFIKYDQIIPNEYKTKVVVNTSDLQSSIERASLLAKEGKNSSIKLIFTDNLLNITSNVEIGNVNEQLSIKLEGQDLEIGFNPKYLIDALKVIDSEEIIIELSTSVSPCIIKPKDNDNYIYLVLPVRIPN